MSFPVNTAQTTVPYRTQVDSDLPLAGGTQSKRSLQIMKMSALAQMGCSFLIILFGAVATGLSSGRHEFEIRAINENSTIHPTRYNDKLYYPGCCFGGTPIWGGIVLFVASCLTAAHLLRRNNRCLRVAYLVLSIIAAVVCGIICIVHAAWIVVFVQSKGATTYIDEDFGKGNWFVECQSTLDGILAMLISIVTLALLNMINFIIHASFWCSNWCVCPGGPGTDQGPSVLQILPASQSTSIEIQPPENQLTKAAAEEEEH